MNLLLKIVEGPNKGAEVALVEGVAVTLGKGEACDIVLADATLPEEPLKIEPSAEGVAIDGEPLALLHVKIVGATAFAVGPSKGAWGKLVWPEPESVPAPEGGEPAPAPVPAEPPPRAKKSRKTGCLLLLLLLAVLAGLAWHFREWLKTKWEPYRPQTEAAWDWTKERAKDACDLCLPHEEATPKKKKGRGDAGVGEAQPTPEEAVAALARRHGLALEKRDGRLSVSGNLKTRAERLSVTAEAYAALPRIDLNLSDDETLKTAVEDTLALIGETDVRVRAVTNRVAVLEGACVNGAALERCLTQEVPKLARIDSEGVRRSMADALGLPSEAVDAQKILDARTAGAAKTPELPVCGILTKPYPCLVTKNGSRILEGAPLGDWTVSKIEADAVVLENATGRFTWRP